MFGRSGTNVRLTADYLLWRKARIGGELYLDLATVPEDGDFGGDSLSIVDLGIGLYRHFRITKSLYFTPLGGAHIAGLTPGFSDGFGTAGIRLEAGLDWVLGKHHVITIVPFSFNYYLPVAEASPGGDDPMDYGFHEGGGMIMFGIGYNYRSAKSIPGVVTLE
jgi:hypothetical protein